MTHSSRGWARTGRCGAILLVASWLASRWATGAAEPLSTEDFSKIETGKVPDSFLILEGQFGVREEGGNRFLELPGSPLESFAAIFGAASKDENAAQARFYGTGQGRRFPVFGLSLNGVGGYRLQVSPAKKALEILKGDQVSATVPYAWESASWTQLRVQLRKAGDGAWKIEGKAWKDGTPEPTDWMIALEEKETPVAGRPAVWGKPFSGTPIRFDDLRVLPVEKK